MGGNNNIILNTYSFWTKITLLVYCGLDVVKAMTGNRTISRPRLYEKNKNLVWSKKKLWCKSERQLDETRFAYKSGELFP